MNFSPDSDGIDTRTVESKRIYIVEQHHCVLLPWARERRGLVSAPVLLSLDHHTDHRPPFLKSLIYLSNDADTESTRREWLDAISFENDASVRDAIMRLSHDEHITTATNANILAAAFSINFQTFADRPPSNEERAYGESMAIEQCLARHEKGLSHPDKPPRPFTYLCTEDRVYAIGSGCFPGCPKAPHDDDCVRDLYHAALETTFLDRQLGVLHEIGVSTGLCKDLWATPFILDIDLDYFHTAKSVSPLDVSSFTRLVRAAICITIARESGCVLSERMDGENITSDWLLDQLFRKIETALKGAG